jgi:hypothetical protein
MVIERPETPEALPEADDYETLGQFYLAIELAIEALAARGDLFGRHQPTSQLSDPTFYTTVQFDADDSGGLVLVADVPSARAAIDVIVHQGEGLRQDKWADTAHRELTHYHKLLRIHDGEVPIGLVRPALVNPRRADLPPALQPVADLFNALHAYLYLTLAAMFGGGGSQGDLVNQLYRLMTRLLAPTARYLMTLPVGAGKVAGPTFEPYSLGPDPKAELADLAAAVAADHPALEHVAALLNAHR